MLSGALSRIAKGASNFTLSKVWPLFDMSTELFRSSEPKVVVSSVSRGASRVAVFLPKRRTAKIHVTIIIILT